MLGTDDGAGGRGRGRRRRSGGLPTDVAVADGTVWVASGRDDGVVAIDAAELSRPPVAPGDRGRAAAHRGRRADSIWTADAGDGTVTRVNPLLPGAAGRRIRIGADAVDVAVGYDGAWVTNGQRGTVTRIDPVSNRVLGPPIRTGNFPTALAIGANFVWVVNSGDGTVARVDPREGLVIGRRTPVGRDPQDIAVGFDSVWVANRGDGTVTRLSAATAKRQGAPIRVGGAPGALAVTSDGVLVLDTESGNVLELDPGVRAHPPRPARPGLPHRARRRRRRRVGRRRAQRHGHAAGGALACAHGCRAHMPAPTCTPRRPSRSPTGTRWRYSNAALGAGLRIERLDEHMDADFDPRRDVLERGDDGRYRLRVTGERLPVLFTLVAAKP